MGRRVGLFAAGLAVLVLSFWIALTAIDSMGGSDVSLADVPLTNDDGTPRTARSSKIDDLPPAPVGYSFSVAWDGIDGLNAMTIGTSPTSNPALSLVATKDGGRHRLGLQLVGVPVGRPIRLTAWIKAPEGTRINVSVRDGKAKGGEGRNEGSAAIDLWPGTILASTGNVRATTELGPGDWVKVPVDMQSGDGVVVIYLGLVGPGDATTFNGSGQQMIFGGLEVTTG
jgi:hypothetical protein